MKSLIYRRWDGKTPPFSLKRSEVVDKFMENIMKGLSSDMALMTLMWEGFSMSGMDFRVMSLKEMVEELRKQMLDLFSKYSLEKAFDDPTSDLRTVLTRETGGRLKVGLDMPPSFEQLPRGLLQRLRYLENFEFLDNCAKEMFEYWNGRRDDILELYEFYSQYNEYFTGPQYLNFDEAFEVMKQFKAMNELEKQIMAGEFEKVDLEELTRILGKEAGESFNIMLQLPGMLSEAGVARFENDQFNLTPRGMRTLGEKAFGNVYRQMKRDRIGRHEGNAPQSGEIEPDSSRPFQFGDRFDLDINTTILKAVAKPGAISGTGEIQLSADEFYVREREQQITSTTVLLLDLSWSMSFGGRFEAAKKVALALDHYVRSRFPKDKIHVVGFSTTARELKGNELASVIWDTANPYTNLQGGLRTAMQLIRKSGNRNNRVLVITDGQPTAYYDSEGHLHVEMPMDMFGLSHNAGKATLAEVRRVTAAGMNIEIFMLDDSPVLVEFSRQICRINRGRAVLCLPDQLGKAVVFGEIKRRGGKV
jgi:Mg-chelatase subunit ChlD